MLYNILEFLIRLFLGISILIIAFIALIIACGFLPVIMIVASIYSILDAVIKDR